MTRTLPILFLPALAVLSCGKKTTSFHHCGSDSECGASQVCFPDGCGDPAQGLRVEIIPNAREGLYAQDFVVGTIANKQDFTLAGRSTIQGMVRQVADGGVPTTYDRPISVQAFGESTVIPGIVRSFELANARSSYVLPVATGTYNVFANAIEEPLPPVRPSDPIQVSSGEAANSDLLFPSATSLAIVNGQLLFGGQPPTADAAMAVQAFDVTSQRPLSQRAQVCSEGQICDVPGQFQLQVAPSSSRVSLQASPVNSSAAIPKRTFIINIPAGPLSLEVGSLVVVTGTLLTSSGAPVSGATVYIEGDALDGGSFRTRSSTTSTSGSFTLTTLRTAAPAGILWAFAPSESPCGLLSMPIRVLGGGNLGAVTCPEKVQVNGSVLRPNGAEAEGVTVTAQPIAATSGQPMPSNLARAITDAAGTYVLNLDPGVYRLDFAPQGTLPRLSRFVTINGEHVGSGFKPVEIEAITLSNGRKLTGTLYFAPSAGTNSPIAALASVRFFRLSTDTSAPASVLLAETVSDSSGGYSVTLPAR